MIAKPKMTIGIFLRKATDFLLYIVFMFMIYFYFIDTYPFLIPLVVLCLYWPLSYILKYLIYDFECKKYDIDLQAYREMNLQKKYESVNARQSGNVNDNIANYKKNKKSVW